MNFEKRCHLAGWAAFVVCAGFFIAGSLRAGDGVMLAGSVIFLVACLVFLAPFFINRASR